MRRLRDWPYWLPVIGGVRGWIAAAAPIFGFYRRTRPVIPTQREASGDYSRSRSILL